MGIKAIIFDFDGVIAESMDIKTKAFAYLFRNYPEDIIEKVVKLHLNNGGMSRYEKFRIIYRDYLKKNLTKADEEQLGKEFSDFCYNAIIKCPYVRGAKEFLKRNYKKYLLFIVSGTPHDEINRIIDERGLQKYFKGVWGVPGSKSDLSKMVLEKYRLKNEEVVFIGDSPTDYKGAEDANIKFIARIQPRKYNPFEAGEYNIQHTISDFLALDDLLDKVDS